MARRLYANLFERLLANSVESETYFFDGTPCWEWVGRIARGYPFLSLRVDGKHSTCRAHRVMAEVVLGRKIDPETETVEHRCEIPWCVNYLHFALVTRAQNTADMRARRRGCQARVPFKPMIDPDLYSVDRLIRSLPVLKTELYSEVCPF